MKKVLYLGGFELPDKNAAAQRVISNGKLLRMMGYEVTYVGISKDIANAPSEVEGFASYPISYPNNTIQWICQITNYISSEKLLDYQPDYVILYNFPAIASLKVLRTCHKRGIKVIHDLTEWEQTEGYFPRDIIKRLDTALRMRYCMKEMDGVIAISRFLYNIYKDEVSTILMPPTVDLSHKKWNRDREISSNCPVTLVYAGSPGSGVKDRLDLLINATKDRKNMLLCIIGLTEDQYADSFHTSHIHYNNIVFKGRLSHPDAVREVCNADFQMLIRDKNRKNEAGFPTKLVESMACGTPVIATIFSNIMDYVHNGENGFIIDNNQTIDAVLDKVAGMNADDIVRMKRNCIDIKVFDYHYYKSEFEKLFV